MRMDHCLAKNNEVKRVEKIQILHGNPEIGYSSISPLPGKPNSSLGWGVAVGVGRMGPGQELASHGA